MTSSSEIQRQGRPGTGSDPVRVAIVGGGAAGVLAATHLAQAATRRTTRIEVAVIDPAEQWARGVAFGTTDREHLLNVPAVGMSALPEDPLHFVRWLAREYDEEIAPGAFVERRVYGRYLDDTVTAAFRDSLELATIRHRRTRVTGVTRVGDGPEARLVLSLADGPDLVVDAAVLATGLPPAETAWAPPALRDSPFFVPDPWAPGALDAIRRDRVGPAPVLLVGTGLTAVDVVLSLTSAQGRERPVVAVSRNGRLPRVHRAEPVLPVAPEIGDWGDTLEEIRARAAEHIRVVEESPDGDWRAAVDGLRFQVAALWRRLSETDRLAFLRDDASAWNLLRHRMAPSSALTINHHRANNRLDVRAGRIVGATPLPRGGVRVELADASTVEAGWVVNCTGPRADIRTLGDPLIDDLLRPVAGVATATVATAGMGLRTRDGRLIDSAGIADAPIWTLGALRRGELWESTAVPEIRGQAAALATAVLEQVAPLPRRLADGRLVSGRHPIARPRDPLGLPLSTTSEAAAAYNSGLERIMKVQSGAEDCLRQAIELDPGFALAHATLAMLGHEGGSAVDVETSLASAQRAGRVRADERERSLVDVVTRRVRDVRGSGTQALTNHIATWPRDVVAVSAAVPTIAFSGVIDVSQAWELVEGLAPAYGDHWWYASLLAFARQDQSRFEEAGLLAESALACEPGSGHAVHAASHAMYETGDHQAGRVWLDHWIAQSGRSASHLAHFSWHAALYDLALGDMEALRRRYYSELADVGGVRALIDTTSLLWRWRVTVTEWDDAVASGLPGRAAGGAFPGEPAPPPAAPVLHHISADLLDRPETPFVALHAALALAADKDASRLGSLRRRCENHTDPVVRSVVATVIDGLEDTLTGDWASAVRRLEEALPVLAKVGGSAAQREIVEETLLWSLVHSGDAVRATEILEARTHRRPSPLDRNRLRSLGSHHRAQTPASRA